MFVLEALLLTFMTTPAVSFLPYPPEMRVRAFATGSNFANVRDGTQGGEAGVHERIGQAVDD